MVDFSGAYRDVPFHTSYKFEYNPVTDTPTYTTRSYYEDGTYDESAELISWTTPARRNYHCAWVEELDNGDGTVTLVTYEYDTLEDHNLVLWGLALPQVALIRRIRRLPRMRKEQRIDCRIVVRPLHRIVLWLESPRALLLACIPLPSFRSSITSIRGL